MPVTRNPLSRTQQSVVSQLSPTPPNRARHVSYQPGCRSERGLRTDSFRRLVGPRAPDNTWAAPTTPHLPPRGAPSSFAVRSHIPLRLRVASAATQPTNATGLTENAATRALIFTRPYTPALSLPRFQSTFHSARHDIARVQNRGGASEWLRAAAVRRCRTPSQLRLYESAGLLGLGSPGRDVVRYLDFASCALARPINIIHCV